MSAEATQVSVRSQAPDAPVMRAATRLRHAGAGILAGLLAGLVASIGARIAMRLVALAIGRPPIFTSETDFLLILGASLGIALGLLYSVLRPHLPGSPWRKGVVFGALLLLGFAPLS